MASRARLWKSLRDGTLALVGLAALGLAAFFIWHEPKEALVHIRATAGRAGGARQRLAEVLRREAALRGIALELSERSGSETALRDVDAGLLDLALVQGGLVLDDLPNLRQVAALHVEPLHLLVKRELHETVGDSLAALRGKSVSLGELGSGTHRLASEVMTFAGLGPGDFVERNLSYAELARATQADLPDAVFMVSTLPSPVARRLVNAHGFRLVALPFFEAFTLGSLDQDPTPLRVPARLATRIDRQHVFDATIPAYTYEVEPGVPPQTIHTLGARLLLVARKDMESRTIRRLLEVLYGSPFA